MLISHLTRNGVNMGTQPMRSIRIYCNRLRGVKRIVSSKVMVNRISRFSYLNKTVLY